MSILPIADLDDPRIAIYRNVKATNETRHSGLFVLEGAKLLDRLLSNTRYSMQSVLVAESQANRIAPRIPASVPVYCVSDDAISDLVGYRFHLGVVSSACRRPAPELGALIRTALDRSRRLTLVVCPAVNDPENLGSMARIGHALGIDAILVGPGCPDPLSRRVLRVSMGAVLRLPVVVEDSLLETFERLCREWSIERVATVADASAESVDTFKRPNRLALVFGNEAQGLSSDWLAHCHRRVTIPMRPGADSLNVAVSGGIILYHIMKQ